MFSSSNSISGEKKQPFAPGSHIKNTFFSLCFFFWNWNRQNKDILFLSVLFK